MTLQSYTSETFDDLAVRLGEISGKCRELAKQQRQSGLESIELNDRKLHEWIVHIEVWAQDASGRQQTQVVFHKGMQRALTVKRQEGSMT